MRSLHLQRVDDTPIRQKTHRFGNYEDEQATLFGVKMPFRATNPRGETELEFDVAFDVIDGDLPFLLGLPSLIAMGAIINHKYLTLSFTLHSQYRRIQLLKSGDHLQLPFEASTIHLDKEKPNDGRKFYSHQYSGKQMKYYSPSANVAGINFYSPPCARAVDTPARENNTVGDNRGTARANTPSNIHPREHNRHRRHPAIVEVPMNERSVQAYYAPCEAGSTKTDECPRQSAADMSEGAYYAPNDTENTTATTAPSDTRNTTTLAHPQHGPVDIRDEATRSMQSNHTAELTRRDITKLHLQLRHGTASALEKYIRAAGLWVNEMAQVIDDVLLKCPCRVASNPVPHTKVASRPPTTDPQAFISIDVVQLGGKNFLHTVDECTSWSEVGHIHRKSMDVQISVLRLIQHLRHGPPRTIRCDREYDNEQFKEFCSEHDTELLPVAANDHEANGLIENANRTLRSFYNRIRLCDSRSPVDVIVKEAVYGKNISLGSKNASAFELLYGRRPRLIPLIDSRLAKPISIEQHAEDVARRRVRKMLRAPIYKVDKIDVGDTVAIWRDGSGWLFPARVTRVTPYYYEVVHNGRLKTSGINRTRLIPTPYGDPVPKCSGRLPIQWHSDENFDDDNYHDLCNEETEPNTEHQAVDELENAGQRVGDVPHPRSANRIAPAELRRVIEDAQPIVQGRMGSTRSQTASLIRETQSNNGDDEHHQASHDYTSETGYQPPYANDGDSSDGESSSASIDVDFISPSLISFVADTVLPIILKSSESSVSKALSDDERKSAFRKELEKWRKREAFTAVEENSVSMDANVIGSHAIYRRKLDGSAKARIVPWGHMDKDKDFIRGDAPSISFEVFRLLLSIAAEMKWEIGQMDIEAAFLQALGFNRVIYVRPPREAGLKGILWRLNLAAYGLTDSGRLWYLTSNDQLVQKHGLTRSRLDYTLYHSCDDDGRLDFIRAVQVDDYLYAGTPKRMEAFEAFLKSTFDVSKFARRSLSLMGCNIEQSKDYSIVLSQKHMLDDIDHHLLMDCAGPKGDSQATNKQATVYRHIIGKMLFIGRMSSPLLLLHASMAASKLADLRTHHLRALATILHRLKQHNAQLHFDSPTSTDHASFILDIISDGATATAAETKGREGHIIFRRCGNTVHPIQWSARYLRRVARSSATAEILAAAEAMSNGLYIKSIMLELKLPTLAELTVDSTSLLSLSTTVKEPEERLNKVDLAAIREAYDDGALHAVHWCPGQKLVADALTKDNRNTAAILLDALDTGTHARPPETATNHGLPS